MKRIFITVILAFAIGESFSQTVDFTLSLLLKLNINDNICKDLLTYKDLISKSKDSCFYICNLHNVATKADSILLDVKLEASLTSDYSTCIEIRQYYHCKDSVIEEYNGYFKGLVNEFNSDALFYRSWLVNIKDKDLDYDCFLDPNNNYYRADLIKLRSLFVWTTIYLSVEKVQNKFILEAQICK